MTIWVNNGLGADTDNSVVGGAGGYTAYPQPPTNGSFNPPESNGQFGPLTVTFSAAGMNSFSISNPGRSA